MIPLPLKPEAGIDEAAVSAFWSAFVAAPVRWRSSRSGLMPVSARSASSHLPANPGPATIMR